MIQYISNRSPTALETREKSFSPSEAMGIEVYTGTYIRGMLPSFSVQKEALLLYRHDRRLSHFSI
jgi:hypothetical protein